MFPKSRQKSCPKRKKKQEPASAPAACSGPSAFAASAAVSAFLTSHHPRAPVGPPPPPPQHSAPAASDPPQPHLQSATSESKVRFPSPLGSLDARRHSRGASRSVRPSCSSRCVAFRSASAHPGARPAARSRARSCRVLLFQGLPRGLVGPRAARAGRGQRVKTCHLSSSPAPKPKTPLRPSAARQKTLTQNEQHKPTQATRARSEQPLWFATHLRLLSPAETTLSCSRTTDRKQQLKRR